MDPNQISKRQKAISLQLEQLDNGKDICENVGCAKSTLSRVLLTKDTILSLAEQDKNLSRKRVSMVTYKEIDEALSKWARQMKRNNIVINAAEAREKAVQIARDMGHEFKPSSGWLYKWKDRENVQFGKTEQPTMQNDDILKGLLERDVENSEETIGMPSKRSKLYDGCVEPNNSTNERSLHFVQSLGSDSEHYEHHTQTIKNAATPVLLTIPRPPPPTASPAKKVLYSYDPVYVLTSTGRYRKEKTFLTLLQKLEILQRLKNGEKRTDLILEYRLSQSAMSQIVADEKKILKLAAIGQNLGMKRIRGGIFKGGEAELNAWVLQKIAVGETLTRTQVKNKAKEIAERMQIDFKASTGWLEKWKVRMNMDFNENQILHRKIPAYFSNTDEASHITEGQHIYDEEAQYHDEEEDQLDVRQVLEQAEDYSFENDNDEEVDIKPLIANGVCEVETANINNKIHSPPPPLKLIAPCSLTKTPSISHSTPVPPSAPAEQTTHQKILNWLSKHNISPSASIELLTILEPIITNQHDHHQLNS